MKTLPYNWRNTPAPTSIRSPGIFSIALDGNRHGADRIVHVTLKATAGRLGHRLLMQLQAAYSRLRRSSNQAFSPFKMLSDQFVVLTVLAEEGQATQQELARRCYSDTETISNLVALLEKKGLLDRKPHPDDGRARNLSLTQAGRHLQRKMWRTRVSVRIDLAQLFDHQEYSHLLT